MKTTRPFILSIATSSKTITNTTVFDERKLVEMYKQISKARALTDANAAGPAGFVYLNDRFVSSSFYVRMAEAFRQSRVVYLKEPPSSK